MGKFYSSFLLNTEIGLLTFSRGKLKERPCTRCIKRNIGHLCHDEPREPSRRSRNGEYDQSFIDDEGSSNEFPSVQGMPRNVDVQDAAGQQLLADGGDMGLPSTVNPAAPASTQAFSSNPQQGMANPRYFVDTGAWEFVGLTSLLQCSNIMTGLGDKVSSKTCITSTLRTCSMRLK